MTTRIFWVIPTCLSEPTCTAIQRANPASLNCYPEKPVRRIQNVFKAYALSLKDSLNIFDPLGDHGTSSDLFQKRLLLKVH